jgi:hypothetical protein
LAIDSPIVEQRRPNDIVISSGVHWDCPESAPALLAEDLVLLGTAACLRDDKISKEVGPRCDFHGALWIFGNLRNERQPVLFVLEVSLEMPSTYDLIRASSILRTIGAVAYKHLLGCPRNGEFDALAQAASLICWYTHCDVIIVFVRILRREGDNRREKGGLRQRCSEDGI